MVVSCAVCGEPFEAKRSTAKYCGDTCRKRKHRGAKVVDLSTAREPESSVDLVASVRADLEAAGVSESPSGQQALAMAARMVAGQADTGSSYAALSRELSRVLSEAKSGATRRADPLDEIARRRAAKAAGA